MNIEIVKITPHKGAREPTESGSQQKGGDISNRLPTSPPQALYTCDILGRITSANASAIALWGRKPNFENDRWCGAWKRFRPDGTPLSPVQSPVAQSVQEGRSSNGDLLLIERPDRTQALIRCFTELMHDPSGALLGVVTTLIPEAPNSSLFSEERKLTPESAHALQQKLDDLNTFLESAVLGMHWVGPDGRILWANSTELNMLGYSQEDYIGHHIAEFHADHDRIEDILRRLKRGERICEYQARLRCKDGSLREVLIDSSVRWDGEQFLHTQCFTRDITEKKRAEEQLRKSEELNRSIIESSHDCIKLISLDGQISFLNPGAKDLLECDDLAELIGSYWPDLWKGADRQACLLAIQEAKAGGMGRFEGFCPTSKGTPKWWDITLSPVRDAQGQIEQLLAVSREITEQKRANEQLVILAKVLESMAEGVVVTQEDGTILYTNPASDKMFGYDPGEQVGKHATMHNDLPPEENARFVNEIIAELKLNGSWQGEFPNVRKDGTRFVSYGRVSTLDLGGRKHWVCVQQDISARKAAEQTLRKTQQQLLTALQGGRMVAWEWDLRTDAVTRLGCTEEVLGLVDLKVSTFFDHVHPDDRASLQALIQNTLQNRGHYETEFRFLKPNGAMVWLHDVGRVVCDDTERPRFLAGVVLDITHRKLAEEKLRESESTLRSFYQSSPLCMGVVELLPDYSDIIHIYDSPATEQFFQRTPGSTAGQSARALGAPSSAVDLWIDKYRLSQREKQPVRFEYLHPRTDGPVWLSSVVTYIGPSSAGQDRFSYITEDITERKRAEEALRENEEQLRAIFSQAAVGIAVADLQARFLEVNHKFTEILGYSPEELRHLSVADITHPEDLLQTQENIRQLVEGRSNEYRCEKRYIRKDGAEVWSATTVTVIKDLNGQPQRYVGVIEDITRRKRAEQELTALKDQIAAELADTRRLHNLSARLLEGADLVPLLHEVLTASIELTGTNRGNLQLYDEGENVLKIVTSVGFNEDFLREFGSVPPGYSVYGKALQKAERIILQNAATDPEYADLAPVYARYGFVAVQSTPLIGSDGRFLGMLSTHFARPHRPTDRELQMLDLCARQAVGVIERKRAEQMRRGLFELVLSVNRARELSDIYTVAIDVICACYKAKRASILLYDADRVMRFKAWRGLSDGYRQAVEGHSPWQPGDLNPQPVCVNDIDEIELEPHLRQVILQEHIRSLAFIPIINDKRLLGKFMIYYNAPHAFSAEEIRLAETIASQLAFAVERHKSGEALERLVVERTRSLKEMVQQMEEFSYTVSHDLRAPLRAMQTYSQVLLEDYEQILGPEGTHYLNRVLDNATRLDKMIVDILTFSRVARAELKIEPVSLDKLVRDLVQHNPFIQNSGAEITILPLNQVLGHEPSLSQAISNLLTNAVKFVRPGVKPRLRIWTERRENDVRLWIEDNGIGVDPQYQHRLFNMFERLHPDLKYEGTGVGLAIVRKAMERMNGKVGVDSDGVNGSRFWIQARAAS